MHFSVAPTIETRKFNLRQVPSSSFTKSIIEIFGILTVVQTKLRRNESSPIREHTSTAVATISNAVPVPDSTPVVPLAENINSVVSIAVTVSFMELLVQWLLAVSVSVAQKYEVEANNRNYLITEAKIVGITIVLRGQARSEDESQMFRWAAACY
ncbi:hypothetical protein BGAL_0349g00110 [Botrytis galanthina]|uniref:Uncharacterized protein n=1 Tax=Botrytis galanthina TaxID=278940 RepID=A0A4S8QQC4_9HELO|nr:hypothetical protein BGAL_0349g00110 [Botrytis galanthina]